MIKVRPNGINYIKWVAILWIRKCYVSHCSLAFSSSVFAVAVSCFGSFKTINWCECSITMQNKFKVWFLFLIDWIKDATLTALSTSSVNAQFVAGSSNHPSTWTVTRGSLLGCEVSDRARLKDCTTYGLRQGSNPIKLGGYAPGTSWWPKFINVHPLTSNREFWQLCSKQLIYNC